MNRLLPFHPAPFEGESHRGYLLRVAAGNGYPNTSWLRSVPGFTHYMTHGQGRTLRGVRAPWAVATLPGDKTPYFCTPPFTLVNEARFCPLCLREGGFWRVEWEWTYYTACHRHYVQLQSTCTNCGRQQTSRRQRLLECSCGSAFSLQIAQPAHTAEIGVSQELFQLQLGLSPTESAVSLHKIVGKNNAEYVSRLIRVLGRHSTAYGQQSPMSKHSVLSLQVAREHVQHTARILNDWPRNFTTFLCHYGQLNDALPGTYVRPTKFSALLRSLPWTWSDASTPIAQVVTEFLENHEPRVLDRRQRKRSSDKKAVSRFVHITVLAQQLRVKVKRLEELVDSGEITAYRKQGGKRRFILVPRQEVPRVDVLLDDAISRKAAAHLLGISRQRFSQLRMDGYILPRNRGPDMVEERYSVCDLRIFLENFKRNLGDRRSLPLVPVSHVCRFVVGSDNEFLELIRALIAGRLKIYGHEPKLGSIGGLLLSKSELQDWRLGLSTKPGALSVVDAADYLEVKQEVAYHLVRKGLITSSMARSGRRVCKLLRLEDLNSFKAKYVAAVSIARLNNTSPKAVVAKLFQHRVDPIAGPRIDGCRQYFYLREQIEVLQVYLM